MVPSMWVVVDEFAFNTAGKLIGGRCWPQTSQRWWEPSMWRLMVPRRWRWRGLWRGYWG